MLVGRDRVIRGYWRMADDWGLSQYRPWFSSQTPQHVSPPCGV